MNTSHFSYEGKLWSPCPTTTGNDGFFHSAFGTRLNGDERYLDGDAKSRRARWAAFLAHFQDEAMPPPLSDVLGKCLSASDGYSHASAEGERQLAKYVSDIAASERKVTMEEIPILATLENATIVVLSDRKEETAFIVKPNPDILGGYPIVPQHPEKVVLCLEGDNFSRLEPAGESPKPKPAKNNANKKSDTSRYKKGGSAGSKGVEYQVSVLSLVMLKALRNESSQWKLSTENEEAGKFDDVVLESAAGDVLIQCKHKENKTRITLEELTSTNSRNDDFSLPKYFLSYLLIREKFKIKNVIICTNADVHEKVLQFLDCPEACSDSLLNYEEGNASFYTLNDKILPLLRENVKKYFHQSLRNKNIDESEITDENLKDFFKHLQLFFNYPSGSRLAEIIDKLLALAKCCRDSCDKIFSSEVYSKAMEWFQQKDGVYLAEIHARAMFSEIWRDKYCQELEQYEVTFQENDLNFQGPERVFHVSCEDSCLLQVIKVYRAIQSSKTKTLFVNPEDGVEVRRQAVKIFAMPPYTFLVIILPKAAVKSDVAEMFDELKDVLQKYNYKKVIFLCDVNNELCQQTRWKEIVRFDGCVTFEHLSKESQGRLSKSKSIDFQGKTVSLEELIASQKTEDYTKSLDSRTIEMLVRGEKVRVGVCPSGLDDDTARCYISRTFNREIGKKTNEGSSNKKRDAFSEKSIYDVSDKMILIVDSAGMGKSTVLTRLATTIKEKNPHLWVIKINLNNYTEILRNSLRRNKDKISIMELLNSQEATKLRNRLEEFVFSIEAKVVLMLDGVDEISPDYTNLVLDLLSRCQDAANFAKMFVTTRPHLFRDMERILKVISFKMVFFTKQNQTDFLTRYWTYNLQVRGDSDDRKCKRYAETLISKVSTWVKSFDNLKNLLTAIPLLVRMLAETFQENVGGNEWEGCKEFLNGDATEPRLPEKFDIVELYDMFIKKKRDVFVDKGSGNTAANQALIDKFEECLPYHRHLALKAILSKTQSELFSDSHRDDKNLESYLLKIGIVQKLSDEFQFVHRTFAEYFVAESITMELKSRNANVEFQRFVIDKVLQKPEFNVVRAFLDNFLRTISDRLPVTVFENYLFKHKSDDVSDGDLIFTLSEEGCLAILRLVLETIHYSTATDVKTKLRHFVSVAKKISNTLTNLHVRMTRFGFNVWDWQGYAPLHLACEGGHLEMVKFLIEQGADLNVRCSGGRTPLHLVLKRGNLDVAKYLLERGPDVTLTDNYNRTALHLAAENGSLDVIRRIVELGIDFNARDGKGRAALHLAAESGDFDSVKYVVELGLDVNGRDGDNCSVLHLAVRSGNLDVVKYLVEHDADVNGRDDKGCPVLHSAAYAGKWSIVEYLVDRGSYVNSRYRDGSTVLLLAAKSDKWDTVKYLMERGADVNLSDVICCTVLHLAVKRKDLDTLACIVKHGAYVNRRDARGCTPLHLAAEFGNWETVEYLAKCDAYINGRDNEGRTVLRLAVASGNWEVIERVMRLNIDVNIKDFDGRTELDLAIKSSNWDLVKYLVERGADPKSRDAQGRTPLHYAVASNHLDSIEILVEHGADVDSRDNSGYKILGLAARCGNWDAVEYLVKCGVCGNNVDKKGRTVLHFATEWGTLNVVKFLVKRGIDVNSRDRFDRTPLHLAYEFGYLEIIGYLQDCGANVHIDYTAQDQAVGCSADTNHEEIKDCSTLHSEAEAGNWDAVIHLAKSGTNINVRNSEGRTLLYVAAASGNWDVAKRLIELEEDVNVKDIHRHTALELAIESGNWEIVNFLVENGADVNSRDSRGRTVLHCAAVNGQLDAIRQLVEHGADVNSRDNDDRTPLGLAAVSDNWEAVRYLMKRSTYGNSADDGGRMVLHLAAMSCHWDVVRCLVDLGVDVNSRDIDGRTALHLAVQLKDWDAVKHLAGRGAFANDRDDKGFTALHYAVTNNHLDSVECLVRHGANVNSRDNEGRAALCLAAQSGNLDVTRYLVGCGADVRNRGDDGYTALHHAVANGRLDVVEYLADRGADVNCRDDKGRTALGLATISNNLDIVEHLLRRGANVKNKEDEGYTVLHYAAANGRLDTVTCLVGFGADVNYRDDNGCPVLFSAVNFGNRDTVGFLMECGADVNSRDKNGCTVLHSATWFSDLDTVRYLVEGGADINARADNGCTPLHYAAAKDRLDIARYLVGCGVDVAVRDNGGRTARDLALEKGQMDTFEYLQEVDVSAVDGVSEGRWYDKLFKRKE